MKTTIRLLPLFILSMHTLTVAALEVEPADTSDWKCKYCLFEEEGFTGTFDLGLGTVSDDSYKFGEYNGLEKNGAFLIGDADLRVRGEDARYWNINLTHLGLDSRSADIEGGKQGSYTFSLEYDELPHYISDSTLTPFNGAGSHSLTLPAGWVRAGTTGSMTELQNNLHAENLQSSRKRLGVGVSVVAADKWQYTVKVRRETREGKHATGGAFFFNSARLIKPVDSVTQQMDVSASYTREGLQARFAYYGSLFFNENKSLSWENPYTSASGADSGQLALPPDNEFHQLMASVGYNMGETTRATADVAVGRMTQNQDFLAATLNTTLAGYPFTLPRRSLSGQVDTVNANVKIASKVTPKLGMSLAYAYNDHDNKTPQASYTWVTTDDSVNVATRSNRPYSFTTSKIKFNADYRVTGNSKISAGIDNEIKERTYQEVSKTTENTYWAKAKTRVAGSVELTLKLAKAERDIGRYEALPWLDFTENPVLRKYNMADRSREQGSLRLEFLGLDAITVGLGFDYANDDYTQSAVGLTKSQDISYSADASAVLSKRTSLYVFLNREIIDSRQAGSSSATTPDWIGENNDVVDTVGLGIKHNIIENKLDVGADYNVTKSRGAVKVGVSLPGFPDTTVDVQSLKLYATYKLQDNLSLRGTYWYEKYDSSSWRYDGVAPATIPNVLALGEVSPSYVVNVIMLSLRYTF